MKSFHYLKYGLSIILMFIGVKMLITDFVHLSVWVSLGVIAGVLTATVWMSIARNKRKPKGSVHENDW
jgi:tellurite resistance protein TerC